LKAEWHLRSLRFDPGCAHLTLLLFTMVAAEIHYYHARFRFSANGQTLELLISQFIDWV